MRSVDHNAMVLQGLYRVLLHLTIKEDDEARGEANTSGRSFDLWASLWYSWGSGLARVRAIDVDRLRKVLAWTILQRLAFNTTYRTYLA